MTNDAPSSSAEVFSFGPFQLLREQRELREAGRPVRLGNRALEILIALIEQPGEVVGKKALLDRVWPNKTVEEASLRVHIAALRKTLGDGRSGVRYVENFSGRGYRFLAPVTRLRGTKSITAAPVEQLHRRRNLPLPLARMLGRMQFVRSVVTRLPQRRFVTIAGSGGIGKTTVALTVAHSLVESYPHGAHFVDLASLADPRRVPETFASSLGISAFSDDPMPGVLAFVKDKSMLIVLDSCEHVIEAAASLAEKVLKAATNVHLLVTSREPLRAEGEWVHRLLPLETPSQGSLLSRTEALTFPAVQLFVEHATASLDTFTLEDADVPIVAEICRGLEGNPLAIELAAARVDLFGIRGLAARLDDRLQVLTNGRRTALPRHQTLRATLDWSYELLSDAQKLMLQRLAVLAGTFDLECAAKVLSDEEISVEDATQAILELSAKSLVTADVVEDEVVYRLLDTTRAYALEKLRDSGELRKIRLRHAEAWSANGSAPFLGHTHPHDSGAWVAAFSRKIDDIQGALGWCFSADSGAPAVLKLTLASLWFEVVLISEFNGELELALETADERPAAGQTLQTHFGVALDGALSNVTGTVRGFTIAQQLGETVSDRRAVFSGLWIGRLAGRDYRCAGLVSDRFAQSNASTEDSKTLPDRMLMVVHHYAGKQALARHHAERVLSQSNDGALTNIGKALQCCHPRALRSRILWLQGFPEQAAQSAPVAVAEGMTAGEPLLACYALVCAILVMVLVGNIAEARRLTKLLRDYSIDHSVSYYELWAGCLEIAIAVRTGEEKIDRRLEASKSPQLGSYLDILSTLSDDLVSTDAIARAESGHGGWCEGESLRVKAQRLLKEHGARAFAESEALILRALEIAHRQSALSLELRAAMSLARLWREQNRIREARELLASVYARFTEGFETTDLVEARSLLDEIPE